MFSLSIPRKTYTAEDVREDIKDFFTNPNHWAYAYGDPTPDCNPDVTYHRKQIEVIFENKYDHWDVNNQVDFLIDECFLRLIETDVANFVLRKDIRYYKYNINKRMKLIKRYGDQSITRAVGKQGEHVCEIMFLLNSFNIEDRNSNKYKGINWTKTDEDLDFILEKDGLNYGVEVKNTLGYMEYEEFTNKLEMCEILGLIPMWVLRNAPEVQFNTIKSKGGIILNFKTQIYPFGQESLVKEMWKLMRLPVFVRGRMFPKIVRILNAFHARNC